MKFLQISFEGAWITGNCKAHGRSQRANMTSNLESDGKTSSRRVTGASFFFGTAFLILAFFYADVPCENSSIVFLLIHGTLQLAYFLIGSLQPNDFTLPILILLDFVTIIWGTIVVVAAYPHWQFESPTDYGYCPRTPYLTAFVYLVTNVVCAFLLLVFGCCCIIYTFVAWFDFFVIVFNFQILNRKLINENLKTRINLKMWNWRDYFFNFLVLHKIWNKCLVQWRNKSYEF